MENNLIEQFITLKPKTLNFMVNDICNSRCKMCNVWKMKKWKELSTEELRFILSDPFFSDLEYVGISGGEPTLRKDLAEIFGVFVSVLKNLKGIGLITNAINTQKVSTSIEKIDQICKQAKVPFNVMVSLDGIGEVHDMVRGRKGNFESAVHILRYLRDKTDIPISIGCTIIKANVWDVDEVLQFCRDENIYGRFRIGEFIDRLYNKDLTEQIRNFDDDERYQIALFFNKLYYSYETSPMIKSTYLNIILMISDNKPRSSGCPYQHSAIGMDCKGNLFFCSPKSPKLGSCLEEMPEKIYYEHIHTRGNIIREHCLSCIHDYHDEPSPIYKEIETRYNEWSQKLSIRDSLVFAKTAEKPVSINREQNLKNPLIIGWYGTETAGDKAILDDIIYRVKSKTSESKITVASMFPFVTKRTLKELGQEDCEVVETYSIDYIKACENSDVVIMGGGPLMGMEPLGFVLAAFASASKAGVPTIIEGCGIGPIKEDIHIETLKEIIRLASVINVRDTKSLEWVQQHTGRFDAVCTGDPATGFVSRFNKENVPRLNNTFACFLREITTEYIGDMSYDEFFSFRERFEEELGKMIRYICQITGFKPLFMPMHTFVIGNDDRDFARRFAKKYLGDIPYEIGKGIYSPYDILSVMAGSDLCLCMRFHSTLFADVLEVPYIPIDYTGGGKILGYLKDKNKADKCLYRETVATGNWGNQINKVLSTLKIYT